MSDYRKTGKKYNITQAGVVTGQADPGIANLLIRPSPTALRSKTANQEEPNSHR
jgi:hypothetical protein